MPEDSDTEGLSSSDTEGLSNSTPQPLRSRDNELLSRAFRLLGSRRSARKTQAARENARRGGRPKGMVVSAETRARSSATKRRKHASSTETPSTQTPSPPS